MSFPDESTVKNLKQIIDAATSILGQVQKELNAKAAVSRQQRSSSYAMGGKRRSHKRRTYRRRTHRRSTQ